MNLLLFITLALWLFLVFTWFTQRRQQMMKRIDELQRSHTPRPAAELKERRQLSFKRLLRYFAVRTGKEQSTTSLAKLQTKLLQSGNPMNVTVAEWIGLRAVLMLVGVILGGLFLVSTTNKLMGLALLLAFLLLGWIGPEFWLSRRVTARRQTILKQLPSALDLLTVSVEAGLGFDQALSKVGSKLNGPLADEFERTLREIQLGSQRMAALSRMADRCGVDDIKTFVSAVVQADKLGVGMSQVLRVQSAEVRRRRKMDAEERAMKAPIKMLFPLVVFVFPALFVIILGPAVLHFMSSFSS